MGQQEVYELLKNRRLSGDDRYFTIREIKGMLLDKDSETNGIPYVSRALERLWYWGIVEKKNYAFRLRKSVLEQSSL
jgi:hypothetical protein